MTDLYFMSFIDLFSFMMVNRITFSVDFFPLMMQYWRVLGWGASIKDIETGEVPLLCYFLLGSYILHSLMVDFDSQVPLMLWIGNRRLHVDFWAVINMPFLMTSVKMELAIDFQKQESKQTVRKHYNWWQIVVSTL